MWELVKKVAGKGENQETDDGVSLLKRGTGEDVLKNKLGGVWVFFYFILLFFLSFFSFFL